MSTESHSEKGLRKALSPLTLWGLGVGYVISGMYFGWNLGLEKGGTSGLAIATLLIIILYVPFTFSYAELACAIPKAGGVLDYAYRAMGRDAGFIAGMAQNFEFIFAPPAIAYAIGAYANHFFPELGILTIAVISYVLITYINIYGVRAAASFELFVTSVAVGGIILFAFVALPHFQTEKFLINFDPKGWKGVLSAIPFAIWFFLGIEGLANVAEETRHPQKDITRGFGLAMTTLVALCIIVFIGSIGIGGWEKIVYKNDGSVSDSPLPMAMIPITGEQSIFYKALLIIGLFGLFASFHGLILSGGRSTLEFSKTGFAPSILSRIHQKHRTPSYALIFNSIAGLLILLTGKTTEIITLSVFGALTLYLIASISIIVLRKKEPEMPRPFRVPLYPFFPMVSLFISVFSLVAMGISNPILSLLYLSFLGITFIIYKIYEKRKKSNE